MRVAVVNCACAPHLRDPEQLLGEYHTLTGWAEAVAAAGADVRVVQAFSREAAVARGGISYEFVASGAVGAGRPARWRWPRALTRRVLESGADVVHVNSLDFAFEAWLLRRTLPRATALVVQDHASPVPRSSSVGTVVRRRLMRAPDAFLFTADAQSDGWRSGGFIHPAQRVYEVVESSTTLRPIDRHSAHAITAVAGRPAVLWVGRLNAVKDPGTVLSGFERALDRLPAATLTMIYGDDELLPSVRRRLQDSPRLASRVRLVGRVARGDLPAFYSAADLFVSGSIREGSGYAVLEASACGLVPVVTDIPAFRVLTGDGAVGALWRPGDPAALARALVDVAARDLIRERASVADHFARCLSWPRLGQRAVSIYRDVRHHRLARAHGR